MLTACGIETYGITITEETVVIEVATVLTACGIETLNKFQHLQMMHLLVATVLTACGIETLYTSSQSSTCLKGCNSAYRLWY